MAHATTAPPIQASKALLDHVPTGQRGPLSNRYRNVIRKGRAQTAVGVHGLVVAEVCEQLASAERWHPDSEYTLFLADLAALLCGHTDEGLAFAAYCLADEALPPEERRRRKAAQAAEAVRAHQDRQPPTEKQVAYLRRLGYTGAIDSKAHASSLIDIYTRGGWVVERGAA